MIIDEGGQSFNDLFSELDLVKVGNWAFLYRHRRTGEFWDVTYPRGEMHGGGPRRLRLLVHCNPDVWEPYPPTPSERR
jgi:hypothetical protein